MTSSTPRNHSGQEVTLVDLAAILVQRRLAFIISFLVVVALGVGYALTATEKYRYVSLLQVAEDSEGEPVEEVGSTLAGLENYWFPAVQADYQQEKGKPLPLGVVFDSPRNTSLVRIETLAPRTRAELVKEVHSALIEQVKARQDSRVEALRQNIQRQLDSVEGVISDLRSAEGQGQALAAAVNNKVDLEGRLDEVASLEVLASARESARKVEPNVSLIIVITVVLAIILATIFAFLVEFSSLVRARLSSQVR